MHPDKKAHDQKERQQDGNQVREEVACWRGEAIVDSLLLQQLFVCIGQGDCTRRGELCSVGQLATDGVAEVVDVDALHFAFGDGFKKLGVRQFCGSRCWPQLWPDDECGRYGDECPNCPAGH